VPPLPVLIGLDEFPVGYSLAGCPPAELASASPTGNDSQQPTLPYNDFSANGNSPLNFVSQPQGALQYVTSFPRPGEKIRISPSGGEEPLWSRSGRELYYRFGTRWFVVDVATQGRFTASRPRLLFEGPFANLPGYSYDVAPDGSHLLVVEGVDQTKTQTELTVVTNIFDEIKRQIALAQK
jgi:hypothetical protein